LLITPWRPAQRPQELPYPHPLKIQLLQ
jgi:hypothetical protein